MRLEKLASESDQLVTAADTVIQDIFDAALYAKETGNDGMVAELKASLKTALLKQNELRTRAAELRRAKEEGTSAEEVAKYAARAIAEVRTPSPPPASYPGGKIKFRLPQGRVERGKPEVALPRHKTPRGSADIFSKFGFFLMF